MQIWFTLVLALQMLAALVMIGLVLIQHGKGADMGASFGSGASGSLFGASGSANFLSRSTAACATVFFISTLALAYIGSGGQRAESGGSVLDRPAAGASQPAPGAAAASGAAPGAIPAAPGAIPGSTSVAPAATGGTPPVSAASAAPGAIPGATAPAPAASR